ncbi:glycoside hydrolase family 5 protein [Mycena maculata]|uniref:Glycoside hydrolase family 5 protein n=1 Tax=Mycena maculata TaxID=230809 RepID=A0AAD7JGR1_9AGAR|nr:glycoside hydrolase family 5 protein [Mycena maculata]
MKLVLSFSLLLSQISTTLAANSWAGANNYFAYALTETDRLALLNGMQAAGMKVRVCVGRDTSNRPQKVLRTWVTGLSAGQRDNDNIAVPHLEANGIGNYDDTVLDFIDQLMVDAESSYSVVDAQVVYATDTDLICHDAGMHDMNALEAGDVYGATYGEEGIYTNAGAALSPFHLLPLSNPWFSLLRITHILNIHENSLLGNQPWSDLSAYILALEPQNEPMIFDQSFYTQMKPNQSYLSWICNAAQQIRTNVGEPNQLIFSGGGSGSASVQSLFFSSSCPAIGAGAIHEYNDGYDSYMPAAVSAAQAAGKKLFIGDGAPSSAAGALRTSTRTNPDPHQGEDYEIQVNRADWCTIESGAQARRLTLVHPLRSVWESSAETWVDQPWVSWTLKRDIADHGASSGSVVLSQRVRTATGMFPRVVNGFSRPENPVSEDLDDVESAK